FLVLFILLRGRWLGVVANDAPLRGVVVVLLDGRVEAGVDGQGPTRLLDRLLLHGFLLGLLRHGFLLGLLLSRGDLFDLGQAQTQGQAIRLGLGLDSLRFFRLGAVAGV